MVQVHRKKVGIEQVILWAMDLEGTSEPIQESVAAARRTLAPIDNAIK